VDTGPNCLNLVAHSEIPRLDATVSEELGSTKWNAEPGLTYFFRIAKERGLLWDSLVPRLHNPSTVKLEIQKYRQSIPMTPDEMFQKFAREEEGDTVTAER